MSIFKAKVSRKRVMKLSRVYGQLERERERPQFLWSAQEQRSYGFYDSSWRRRVGDRRQGAEGHTNLAFEAFPVFSSKGSAHQGPVLWGIIFWALETCREDRPCTVQDFLGCTWQKVTHMLVSHKKHLLAHKLERQGDSLFHSVLVSDVQMLLLGPLRGHSSSTLLVFPTRTNLLLACCSLPRASLNPCPSPCMAWHHLLTTRHLHFTYLKFSTSEEKNEKGKSRASGFKKQPHCEHG